MNALRLLQNLRLNQNRRFNTLICPQTIVTRNCLKVSHGVESWKADFQQVRCYPIGGNIGSGAGKGGGDGGTVRRSGGALGELGAAHEEEYFFRKQREQLEKIKKKMKRDAKDPKSEQKSSDE